MSDLRVTRLCSGTFKIGFLPFDQTVDRGTDVCLSDCSWTQTCRNTPSFIIGLLFLNCGGRAEARTYFGKIAICWHRAHSGRLVSLAVGQQIKAHALVFVSPHPIPLQLRY
ncbi:hypothetical protein J6590_060718 [Homalodisca vitripennis]|nr:hypothetical protein J6590_060718 [Homalodisca vitripennis]